MPQPHTSALLPILTSCIYLPFSCVQVAWPFVVLLPGLMALLRLVRPGKGTAVYLPSTLLRYLAFKLTVDVQHLPALQARQLGWA